MFSWSCTARDLRMVAVSRFRGAAGVREIHSEIYSSSSSWHLLDVWPEMNGFMGGEWRRWV